MEGWRDGGRDGWGKGCREGWRRESGVERWRAE